MGFLGYRQHETHYFSNAISSVYAEKMSSSRGKPNPLVMISVIKKPGTSNVKSPAEPIEKEKEEDDKTNTTTGLLSLCQSYGSDED